MTYNVFSGTLNLTQSINQSISIGFCLTGTISMCLDSFVFMFVFILSYACVLYYCNMVGWTWWD